MGCEEALKAYHTPWPIVLVGLAWQCIIAFVLMSNSITTSSRQNSPSNEKDDFENNKVEQISVNENDPLILSENRYNIVKKWSRRISNHRYYRRLQMFLAIYETASMIIVVVTDMTTFGDYLKNHKDLSGWIHYQCYAKILLSSSNGKTLMVNTLRIFVGRFLFYFQKKQTE
ncbi:hypothetical protein RFI_13075 [Reticulomyxa filosa]|uniref:Uncharacterized protein n=1 Tax=Reticulomyxa filosa TaxID=46433 RepID=X6NCP1_RETFI|nr:hypothetical protein RFI_13075 [Reticulomyxa filosa]|eukprot:ETO24085.1 hypothetical protein RFI_13075 [Reticulomyxa filosa]